MVGRYPAGIDPALMHLTGTIVTWWGRIEGILVGDLISLRQSGAAASFAEKRPFPTSTGQIIEQWIALRKLVFADKPHKLTQLDEVIKGLVEGAEDRHVIVHSFWPYGAQGDGSKLTLSSTRAKRGEPHMIEFRQHQISVESLDEINERLASLYHKVMIMSVQLGFGPDRIRGT